MSKSASDPSKECKWDKTLGKYVPKASPLAYTLFINDKREDYNKENMKLEACSGFAFDRKDPVNVGVIADQLVGTSQGVMMRRVRYQDPLTRQLFEFVTSEHSLQPGWIAHLYRLRWNIEKVFDEFKNKLSETKSWAAKPAMLVIRVTNACSRGFPEKFSFRSYSDLIIASHAPMFCSLTTRLSS